MRDAYDRIRLRGVRQNNLKNLDLDLPLGELIVITGVSGSGKSSLAFDTVYAEGQRRYVETFSPYARQFLDRMDRPQAERIDGIPPAIAIDQTNPVRTSRSTVGTMTELNDHLKLLFARAARLFCRGCGREVRRDTPESIWGALTHRTGQDRSAAGERPDPVRALICFDVPVPESMTADQLKALLGQQGYIRFLSESETRLEVIQDRLKLDADSQSRAVEALAAALEHGRGRLRVYPLDAERNPGAPWRFSADLHCPDCDIHYRDPQPALFSFNSPLGACDTCRGFGRVIGIDWSLVVPDASKSLLEGAIKPIQSDSYFEVQEDLMAFAHRRGVPTDVPWRELSAADRDWVLEGEGEWEERVWYGIRRFFAWLEGRAYKMHVRVLLSRYRSYDTCPACAGARLKDAALDFRVGDHGLADAALQRSERFRHARVQMADTAWLGLPGLNVHDVMRLPIARCRAFFDDLTLPGTMDQAMELLLGNIRSRLRYLTEVGLGYLTLERQSRTLSGGEVQRINLTTALGTSLVNTLFVLDEPSIGLHPRDMDRVAGILHRLRDQGNTLLVVEHDPQVMRAADRILDIGPGPGERGGELVFQGTPSALLATAGSLTGDYLSGRRQVEPPREPQPPAAGDPAIGIAGARAHNLRGIDVDIPLGRLVVVTGVSGSGKSTLVQDVLFHHLAKAKGHPEGAAGECTAVTGEDLVGDVLMLDQSPIGRSSRSNPASFVGALDPIRKLFAATPKARERGCKAGHFSFNSGPGRCPTCAGSGFEHVEMQFLSDVYLRCPDCNGRRYKSELLEVRLPAPAEGTADTAPAMGTTTGLNIADVLELTVAEALTRFARQPEVTRALKPLADVGLDYLRLGQPVPTLSGGEAQRLKLAGHLAKSLKRRRGAGLLFLLDEPTTGLHFDDIATLLKAFRRLVDAGHSLVVIEHNLDLIRAADWLIDLGPEGGDGGGDIVCTGTPADVARHPTSHTGRALREAVASSEERVARGEEQVAEGLVSEARATYAVEAGSPSQLAPRNSTLDPRNSILIRHAREHNLKDLTLSIPRERFIVVTGVSGSGKSTLAFDILFAEGQRRYLESLNAYARQFVQPAARADVDAIFGIPPTIAIEQRTSRGGRKSTVGTLTEIHHFLRLLYVKLGVQHCPECNLPIAAQPRSAILERLRSEHTGSTVTLLAPLVIARKGIYNDLAAWAARQGHSLLWVDGEPVPTQPWPKLDRFREHDIDLPVCDLDPGDSDEAALAAYLDQALDLGKGLVRVLPPFAAAPVVTYSTSRTCPGCGKGFEEPDPRLFSYNSKHGWCPVCFGTGAALTGFDAEQTGEEGQWLEADSAGTEAGICPACDGARLNTEALAVRLHRCNIAELSGLTVTAAAHWLGELHLDARERAIGADVIKEVHNRLGFLAQVGLGYLTLDRAAPTLSGGEAQRIRLAAQLGSNLRGVCYVLDEPSIGLHHRDNARLIETLAGLRDRGNSVIVVEHDEDTMRSADEIIDLGPGAGAGGGSLVARGSAAELAAVPGSVTGRYLARAPAPPQREPRPCPPAPSKRVLIRGARLHNLDNLDLSIPLARLVCVTGVSGSGKSTLVRDVLARSVQGLLSGERRGPPGRNGVLHGCREVKGWRALSRVLEVDQTPIGKTPRSCPATYVGFWDHIRRLFAAVPEARMLGWGPGRFSFNTKGGRCDACDGQGVQRMEMSFLPDVTLPCEVCHGSRFNAETRSIRYHGHGIGEVLGLSVDSALELFAAHQAVRRPLELLQAVGLGYLTLGQASPTLSGGEAQRIKLVSELAKARSDAAGRAERPTLYVLDEPSVGLHMADVERLIAVLQRLVDAGHSVVVIEHDLDLVAAADWVLDLGPEGGSAGGRIVAEGPPTALAAADKGHTAAALRGKLGLG
ncbi:excinuclease ABC subunit A [Thiohalocapsa halophila]|uniref:UvrABC system protein A n=1 Tax=Thiohalocapsa halophila TaxID=69359 RepID=A0ABS1CLW3_9GAMM|nr:excinuclease ABC subunit UvrA [Thiohalocapsa halophila]MBK1632910.1 excinuclease ABC subunit A [Thiohalocapsa halophila]